MILLVESKVKMRMMTARVYIEADDLDEDAQKRKKQSNR